MAVPLGLGISKVTAIGQRPVSLGIQYYHNVERPDTEPANQIRFQVGEQGHPAAHRRA